MPRAAVDELVDAATALAHRDDLAFVEVAPANAVGGHADPIVGGIPGAYAAGIRSDFAGPPAATGAGGLLADPRRLRALASAWGRGRRIVLYTRRAEDLTTTSRAWFSLAHAGLDAVSVLDGGLPAWVDGGGPLGSTITDRLDAPLDDAGAAGAATPTARHPPLRVLETDEVLDVASFGTLLDARPLDAYRGALDDPRSGHVPGALSAPAAELLGRDGRMLSRNELRRWLLARRAIGSQEVGVYCGSGGASSAIVFAGALLGQDIALYADSWPRWANDPSLPVERGDALARSSTTDLDCVDAAFDADAG